jgi:AraC family transcriptional regulator
MQTGTKVTLMDPLVDPAQRELLSDRAQGDYFFFELTSRRKGPLAIALGGREWCAADYEVQRRTYPFATIEYVAEGQGELRLGGGPMVPLTAGSLFAYGPDMPVHLRTVGSGMMKYFVSLTGAKATEALQSPVNLCGTHLQLRGHAEILDTLDLMIREGREPAPRADQICLNLFQRLQLKLEQALLSHNHSQDRALETFLRCKTLIDADPLPFRSLADVVAQTKTPRPVLFRLFRRYQGVTPYQYILRQKMHAAARAIIGGNPLIKEIAATVGFDDPLHFSRVFKSVHGVSPSQLRASLRP